MTGNLFDLLQRLSKAGVDFVTVGGFAGVVHGCTCVTQDIDICCDFSADNLLRLQEALKDVDAVHRMTAQHKGAEAKHLCRFVDDFSIRFDTVAAVTFGAAVSRQVEDNGVESLKMTQRRRPIETRPSRAMYED